MSIILEALKKASVSKNVRASGPVGFKPQEEEAKVQAAEMPGTNNFDLTRTMFMALAAILAVGIVAFFTGHLNDETGKTQGLVSNTGTADFPVNASAAKTETVAEGYTSVPLPAQKKESPLNSFITKLSNPHLTLSGIVYGIGKPTAIIEDRILEEGSSIKGAKIVKIYSDSVEMLDEATGQTFVLKVD